MSAAEREHSNARPASVGRVIHRTDKGEAPAVCGASPYPVRRSDGEAMAAGAQRVGAEPLRRAVVDVNVEAVDAAATAV